ncbi:DegV family protein [Parasporobacterium paucivorans]|uniref:EDD domain protein, DegV family n=1 Tax=Parasporobacterium paucivorans DSM 15970 TaxID=1122934 RepID=A0A1M6GP46_9FIRM|nr:DegV family protein [Parasporobacterium paucivorans]SHJ11630.1 EDD domain protein, DegV family [Parasporobacterium paucivorans DSM 15970]
MGVRLIIDSACDMEKSEADRENILFLPLKTIFGEEEYLDGVTISHERFYEKLIEEDVIPKTSQVVPFEYGEVFKEVLASGDSAVVITISSKLSGTHASAVIAARGYEDRIYVVDSGNVSIGEQILVRYAMQLRDQGLEAGEIAAKLNEEKKKACLVALLDTLEYLKLGGRISKTSAFAGELLSIKPVISVEDGEIKVVGKARGSKKGNNLLNLKVNEKGGIDFEKPICLGYTGLNNHLLQKYIADSEALWKDYTGKLPISMIGSTVGTHAGPGAVAVAFFTKI